MTDELTPRQKTGKRALSVAVAEGAGLAVSFGALALVKGAMGPERTEHLKEWVATKLLLPFIKKGDAAGLAIGKEKPKEGEEAPFLQPPPEERARKMAATFVDMAVLLPVGILTRLGVQKVTDDRMGVPNNLTNYVFSRVVDNSIGAVTLLGLNTVAKDQAKAVNKTLASVFEKVGIDAQTADSVAKYAVYAQTPNLTGMAANLATLHVMDIKQGATKSR